MELSWDLFINALVSGLLLGGFYAAVAVGITIAFGMLDIVNIAHPAFIVLGAFIAYYLNTTFGIDPLLSAALAAPLAYIGAGFFFALPALNVLPFHVYRVWRNELGQQFASVDL